jgi:hypothetical protein
VPNGVSASVNDLFRRRLVALVVVAGQPCSSHSHRLFGLLGLSGFMLSGEVLVLWLGFSLFCRALLLMKVGGGSR